jgi:ribulose-5-phosphate 4-epimerase/fuculose-1-phosphate aldolase
MRTTDEDIRQAIPTSALRETPPPLVPEISLSAEQCVAVLARALHRIGYADHVSGHITSLQPNGTLLATPWPFNWDEIAASDILRIDLDGHVLEGKWRISPGIPLHLALHRARPNVKVSVHNHTLHSQIWVAARKAPPILDQTSALTNAKVVVVDEFDGSVGDYSTAERTIQKVGDGEIALLGGHGMLLVADDASQLFRNAHAFEWRSRIAWQAASLGGGVPLPAEAADSLGSFPFPGFWEGAVRREVRLDPTVLD